MSRREDNAQLRLTALLLNCSVGGIKGFIMKRAVLTLLILAVVTSCLACPRTSLAGAKYSGGTGDSNDPYQIANVTDLLTLANDVNDYNKCFILTADIDLAPCLPDGQVFTTAVIARDIEQQQFDNPFDGNAFTGVFDGAGHRIINLTIDTSDYYLGLFGEVNGGEIKNLGIEDANINGRLGSCIIGGLVGWNIGNISKCYSTGSVGGVDHFSYGIGGLAGRNNGSITNCYSTARLDCGEYGVTEGGGLVGWNYGSITNCYSTGAVIGGAGGFGGLIGSNSGAVIACFWDVNTSGRSSSEGGTGKTTEQMKTESTFTDAGWDFVWETTNGTEDIWYIREGAGYPKLSWQYDITGDTDANSNVGLTWTAGLNAVSHDVYTGTGFNEVNDANTASSQNKGNQLLDANSVTLSGLRRCTTYYRHIDESGNDGNITFVGWWNFDETDGTIAYDSAGGNNGTLINGPVWTSGKINGALAFDGFNDYVKIYNKSFNLTSQVTVSAWVNTSSRRAHQAIVGQWNYINKRSILLDARGDDSQKFCFCLSDGGANKTIVSSFERFPPDTWYYVVGTYDGSMMKLYINGRLDSSIERTGPISVNKTEWDIGAFNYGRDGHFNGLIDDVRIYSIALTEDQIRAAFLKVAQKSSAWYCFGIDCEEFIQPEYLRSDVPDMIKIANPRDVETTRSNIISYLWPTTGWPGDKMPESVTTDYEPNNGLEWYVDLNNIGLVDRVDLLDIKMDPYGDDYWHSYAYLLHPKTMRQSLANLPPGPRRQDAVHGRR